MNKPVNYKEIEEFAKSINLDVKYLLGEFCEDNLVLRSLQELPENTTFNVGGDLYLDSLKELPENTTFNVGGSLDLSSLQNLSKNIVFNVGGYLYLSSLKELPENTTFNVGGFLSLNSLKELPENTTFNVGRNLYLNSLQELPENTTFYVGSSLELRSLQELPENIIFNVGENLYLSSLKSLPENIVFNVGWSLDLYSLKELPENIIFNVGENLWLVSLKNLSNSYKITLKGDIYIDDEDILSKIVYKKLEEDDIMYFENDYILVDGIYCKVLKNHEGIKKCQYIGSTKEFYIVSSNGKHSHGKTIEEAKKDLIYKISNRDKSSYKNLKKNSILSFEEAVECYRVITGACFFGTKNFIETYNVPQKDYSIKEIIKLTQNQYGGNTFKEFFK